MTTGRRCSSPSFSRSASIDSSLFCLILVADRPENGVQTTHRILPQLAAELRQESGRAPEGGGRQSVTVRTVPGADRAAALADGEAEPGSMATGLPSSTVTVDGVAGHDQVASPRSIAPATSVVRK